MAAERAVDLIRGSHHDTLAWLALVKNPAALQGPSLFEAASTVWTQGLGD